MKYLSVCSGIEAASVAWHPMGWEPVAFAEIEAFPSAMLAHHYPSVPNWGDMTKFKEWPDATVDLLVGGTPCQSFSVAGLRKGLADPRGNLALTYLAIADKYRPEWLVWENVPGVLSSDDGRAFGAFLGGLVELGYGWAYRVLDAQFFGLAQRRKRVFVVANSRSWQRAAAVLFDSASLRGDSAPRREEGEGVTNALTEHPDRGGGNSEGQRLIAMTAPTLQSQRTGGGGPRGDFHYDGGLIPEIVGTLSDGAHMGGGSLCLNAGGMGRIDAESETLIPTGGFLDEAAPIQSVQAVREKKANGIGIGAAGDPMFTMTGRDQHAVAHLLRGEGFYASEDGTGRGTPLVAELILDAESNRHQSTAGSKTSFRRYDPRVDLALGPHGADAGDIAPTLRSGGHDKSHANGGVMPAIAFDARQSDVIQYGEKTGPLDTNGHSVGVFHEVAATLKEGSGARGYPDPSDGNGHQLVGSAMQVRRLTPRECERLQGFPDDYTLIPHRGKPAADGPRYKALGNSMAVPCMAWIGRRIQQVSEIEQVEAIA